MMTTKQLRRGAKQLFRSCVVDGVLDDDRVRKVVQRVLEGDHRGSMILLSYFQRLVKLERSEHTAEVDSALILPPDFRARILSTLEHLYGPGISTSFVQNPALIGGMRIKVGSDVYDGSVRANLAALQRSFS
jgi:F-type H+-transporting ATPase subunit delta